MKRTFDRLYIPDERDNKYKFQRISTQKPYQYWKSRYFGDQGSEGACVGFAWMHWLESQPISQYVLGRGIYKFAQYIDEWPGEDYEGTSVRAGAQVLRDLGFIKEFRWGTKATQIAKTVSEVGSVVIGINWYGEMMYVDSQGFIHPEGELMGGHAILIDGVNNVDKKFRLKNSWSRDWGVNGRCWLTFDDLQILLDQEGEACLGIEQKPPQN